MRLLVLFIICNLFCMCGQSQNEYCIKGVIKGYKNGKIFVSHYLPNKQLTPDTIIVKNNKFKYRGEVSTFHCAYFKIPQKINKGGLSGFKLFICPGKTIVKVDINDLSNIQVKKSYYNSMMQSVLSGKEAKSYNTARLKFRRYSRKKGTDLYVEALKEYKSTKKVFDSVIYNLEDYSTNPLAAYLVYKFYINSSIECKEKYLRKFDKSMDGNAYVKYLKEDVCFSKRIKKGNFAPNFCLNDMYGNKYKLSDYIGKYVLIEFSTSWCGSCKKEIPYLKKVYEEFKDKNLVIFTINMDSDKNRFIKEVKKENFPWPVIRDKDGFYGIGRHYNIKSIPRIFLISPEGIILNDRLRGEGIYKCLKEVFSN